MSVSRRRYLGLAAGATAGTVLAPALDALDALDQGSARAASASDLSAIKHVVVLMQENHSFDHYLGMLSGVRGFDDRSTILQACRRGDGTSQPSRPRVGRPNVP